MKKVTTPDGPMYVAGSLWPLGALFIDLVMMLLIMSIAVILLLLVGFEWPDWAIWIPGALTIGYGILTYRHAVPGLGKWALGLRKYPRNLVEGYVAKGSLLLVEDLALSVRIGRLIAAFIVVGILFMVLIGFGQG